MSKRARSIARVHKILGLVVGVQLLFWTLSGFYFTLFPIETIRGEHLRRAPTAIDLSTLGAVAMPALPSPADTLEIRMLLGEPVWFAKGQNGAGFFSLETGAAMPALNEADIRQIAEAAGRGKGRLHLLNGSKTPRAKRSARRRSGGSSLMAGTGQRSGWMPTRAGSARCGPANGDCSMCSGDFISWMSPETTGSIAGG